MIISNIFFRYSPSKDTTRNKSDLKKGFYKRSPTKELSDVFIKLSVGGTTDQSNVILEAVINNNDAARKNLEWSSNISNDTKDNNNNSDFKSLEDSSKVMKDEELLSNNMKIPDKLKTPVNSLLKKSLFNLQAKKAIS